MKIGGRKAFRFVKMDLVESRAEAVNSGDMTGIRPLIPDRVPVNYWDSS